MIIRKNGYKISVVVPVYNEEGCIALVSERILRSISAYTDYEILFVDDGSKNSK